MNIRSSIYGSYQGKEYEIDRDYDGQTLLFSEDKQDLEHGFTLTDGCDDVYEKRVDPGHVTGVYSVTSYTMYNGIKMRVENSVDGKLVLHYQDTEEGKKMGFITAERDHCYKLVDPSEIGEVFEEKHTLKWD